MSLISGRNFIEPLTNKHNIVTILLIAFFFGVYRLAGGGISSSTFGTNVTTPRAPATSSVPQANSARVESRPRPAQAPTGDIVLDDLLKRPTRGTEPVQQPNRPEGGDLSEIERSLGLR